MAIKAKFENGCFVPLENVNEIKKKYNGKEIKIEIVPNLRELKGVLKEIKLSSVELQHEGLRYFGKKCT